MSSKNIANLTINIVTLAWLLNMLIIKNEVVNTGDRNKMSENNILFYETRMYNKTSYTIGISHNMGIITLTIVKQKQAGTYGRSMKHHPRCQISIYVQFSLWW